MNTGQHAYVTQRVERHLTNHCLSIRLADELDTAERKAWDALSRYKFQMFGYWAAIWVHLNRISGEKRPNPFRDLVRLAREIKDETRHD